MTLGPSGFCLCVVAVVVSIGVVLFVCFFVCRRVMLLFSCPMFFYWLYIDAVLRIGSDVVSRPPALT